MVLPMDMPDDYLWLPGSGKSTLGDLGELAARLGSIDTYDRRGAVYWLDDFESGLAPWLVQTNGLDASVDLVNTPTFRGDFAAKLTTGSDESQLAGVLKRLAPSLVSSYGYEATFSIASDIDSIYISFQKNDGINKMAVVIFVSITDQTLKYYNAAGGATLIRNIDIDADDGNLFNTIKLVADFEKEEYVRVMFNQLEVSLEGISIFKDADATIPRLEAAFNSYGTTSNNGIAYLDSVIVTIGDP